MKGIIITPPERMVTTYCVWAKIITNLYNIKVPRKLKKRIKLGLVLERECNFIKKLLVEKI